ncbi:MAG: hypothetical protein NTY74_11240 [Ignavibacteriae bacterium]|nr:hypothetical protein [Ignavibacteriota bacterium]
MKTKYNLILLLIPVITMCLVYYSCDNPTNGDPAYKGMIQGWVYDDSIRLPLSYVKVWADGIPDTLYTNDSGRFHFTKISMPRGEFNYYLIFQKSGYIDKSYFIYVKSDIESKIDSVFLKRTF